MVLIIVQWSIYPKTYLLRLQLNLKESKTAEYIVEGMFLYVDNTCSVMNQIPTNVIWPNALHQMMKKIRGEGWWGWEFILHDEMRFDSIK